MTDNQDLAQQLDKLLSKDAIRDCVLRVNRGVDRIDVDLLRAAFHSDAMVQWGSPEAVPVEQWLAIFPKIQEKTRQAQHLVGNVLIELDGDTANVESYEIARHLTEMGEAWNDLIYSARYLDRFTRRNGEWKIKSRVKILDWMRTFEGSDPSFDKSPLKGVRGADDLSYQMFGDKAFATGL